jgi:hypothetical protein
MAGDRRQGATSCRRARDVTKNEKRAAAADEKAARDGLTFYQRYLTSATGVELALYFHPGGIVSGSTTAPTREEMVAGVMAIPVGVCAPGESWSRKYTKPTREEAERFVDAAAEWWKTFEANPPTRAWPLIAWTDRRGHRLVNTLSRVTDGEGVTRWFPELARRDDPTPTPLELANPLPDWPPDDDASRDERTADDSLGESF